MKQINTTPQDWFNHIAQGITSNALIQYVMKPNGHIDYQLLKKAVLLSIQEEPVLGCIFVENEPMPVWKPVPVDVDDICFLINTKNIEEEINAFLAKELNASIRPPIEVCLINDGKSDAIVIKMSHATCDGSGSKYYLKLLADIYTRLAKNNSFIPQSKAPIRGTSNLYKAIGINDINSHFNPEKANLISTWGFPTIEEASATQKFSYQLLRYRESEFQKIKQFAKKQKVTINTLLIAAYHLALLEVLKPTAGTKKEIQFMIDLRKFLPTNTKQTICNLSSILNVNLFTHERHFSDILKQTKIAMEDVLASDSLIHGVIACDLAEESGFSATAEFIKSDWENIKKTGNCTPMISNLGMLDSAQISFGETKIKDIYLISPAFYAPAFMLGVSTYNNVLTICASYYSPGIKHERICNIINQMNHILNPFISLSCP